MNQRKLGINSSNFHSKINILIIKMYMQELFTILCILYCNLSKTDAFINVKSLLAQTNEFSFVVSIDEAIDDRHICGGALISQKHVLTTEHCVHNKRGRDLQVSIGNNDFGRKYNVLSIMRFDDWTKRRHSVVYPNNDVAILTLETDVSDIEPAMIDNKFPNAAFYGKNVVTADWSEDYDGKVQQTFLKVLTPDECSESIFRLTRKRFVINEKYFCTTSVTQSLINKGNEGCPVLYNNRIIGVNQGIFPDVIGDYPAEQNLHIGIEHYRRFIRDVLSSD